MSSPSKRRDMDVMKLMMSDFDVCLGVSESPSDFFVKFRAPKDSLYEGGIYRVHVNLPASYPYKSPSIGFCTRIFHPNVDESSGSVCLDVINQTWSPMYDLCNIFSVFLPQLLLYPNPADPLNGHAAALMFKEPDKYRAHIHAHVRQHAMVDFKLDDADDDAEPMQVATAATTSKDEEEEAEDDAIDDGAGDEEPMSDPDEEIMSDIDDNTKGEDDGIKAEA